MDYKKNHSYNYGYLSAQVKFSIGSIEAILSSKSVSKNDLKRILKDLKDAYEQTENNLRQE